MGPNARAKDPDISGADNNVPDKVASGKCLDHPRGTCISVDALDCTVLHVITFLIGPHDPQGQAIDQRRLQQRHHVDIPVDSSSSIELLVDVGEEDVGQEWRDDRLGGLVQDEGEKDLVDMVWEGREVERFGIGLGQVKEPLWGWRERVSHLVKGGGGDEWWCW